MADYRELVEFIVRNIVDHPDAVEVESRGRHRAETIEIRLDPGDVGRVIGKSGRNIEAIRSVVKAAAIKDHKRVNVEVVSESEEYQAAHGDEAEGAGEHEPSATPVNESENQEHAAHAAAAEPAE